MLLEPDQESQTFEISIFRIERDGSEYAAEMIVGDRESCLRPRPLETRLRIKPAGANSMLKRCNIRIESAPAVH